MASGNHPLTFMNLPLEVRHYVFGLVAARGRQPKRLLQGWFEKEEIARKREEMGEEVEGGDEQEEGEDERGGVEEEGADEDNEDAGEEDSVDAEEEHDDEAEDDDSEGAGQGREDDDSTINVVSAVSSSTASAGAQAQLSSKQTTVNAAQPSAALSKATATIDQASLQTLQVPSQSSTHTTQTQTQAPPQTKLFGKGGQAEESRSDTSLINAQAGPVAGLQGGASASVPTESGDDSDTAAEALNQQLLREFGDDSSTAGVSLDDVEDGQQQALSGVIDEEEAQDDDEGENAEGGIDEDDDEDDDEGDGEDNANEDEADENGDEDDDNEDEDDDNEDEDDEHQDEDDEDGEDDDQDEDEDGEEVSDEELDEEDDFTIAYQQQVRSVPVITAHPKWRHIPHFMRITHCPPPVALLLTSKQLNIEAKGWFYDVATLRIEATGSFAHTSFFEEAFSQITEAAFSPMKNIRKVNIAFVWDTTWLRSDQAESADAIFPALLRQRALFVVGILTQAPNLIKVDIDWHDSAEDEESLDFMNDVLAGFLALPAQVAVKTHYIAVDAKPHRKSVAGRRRAEFKNLVDSGLDRLF